MKKYILIISACIVSFGLFAQTKNYLGITANLGEYSLLSDIDNVSLKSSLGVGGTIGGVYELSYKHFLFDLGVNVQISHTVFGVTKHNEVLKNQIDSQGDKLDYIFVVDKRKDSYTSLDVQIPLMLGGQWNKFYFLAGVKFDISVLGLANSKALLSSEGDYDKFIENFKDMPQHGFFTDYPLKAKGKIRFNPEALASLEIGWRLGEIYKGTGFDVPKPKKIYRLGFFVDYGLPIMDRHNVEQNQVSLETPTTFDYSINMASKVVLHDILNSMDAQNKVNSLLVGVKFTVLFQMPEGRPCVICRDNYRGAQHPTRTSGRIYSLIGKGKRKIVQ